LKKQGFSKGARILKSKDFRHVFLKGKRIQTPRYVIRLYPNGLDQWRLGISISKKVSGVVDRNRTKRILREIFRTHRMAWGYPRDLMIVVKKLPHHLGLQEIRQELLQALSQSFPEISPHD